MSPPCFIPGAAPLPSLSSRAPQPLPGGSRQQPSPRLSPRRARAQRRRCAMAAGPEPTEPPAVPDAVRNDGRSTAGMFGLRIETNGDVIKFGFAAIAAAYAFKTALTLVGVRDLLAGQITTGFVSVASLLAWVSTYVFRVGTKGMTYAQQLRDYENAVIQKRFEELSPDEAEALIEEVEEDL